MNNIHNNINNNDIIMGDRRQQQNERDTRLIMRQETGVFYRIPRRSSVKLIPSQIYLICP